MRQLGRFFLVPQRRIHYTLVIFKVQYHSKFLRK